MIFTTRDIGMRSRSLWTIDLARGRLIFEFADGCVLSVRHERSGDEEIVYDYPFSGRHPCSEVSVRSFVARYGAEYTASDLERNQYVRFRTEFVFDRLVRLARGGAHRILDFGCGAGHSLDALLTYFPNARFVGSDISAERLDVLHSRLSGIDRERTGIIHMRSPTELAALGSNFDLINLNAVFEHLLPDERRRLLRGLWSKLADNGTLVLTETPWRWFPIETHTTSLPLINYLPNRLALGLARHCGRYDAALTWNDALKEGLRGATVAEIITCVDAPGGTLQLVQSDAPDARDLLETWWWGESRHTRQKALAYEILSWLRRLTGIVVSPWVNVVLRKTGGP